MKSDIMISFIIPAYNAEKTLERCIESIISYKTEELEVLVIENGSSDMTTSISQKLEKRDSRIKLYHSEKGVSNARNLGMQEASGKWIVFVDADDEIKTDQLNNLFDDAKCEDADMILYGHCIQKNIKSVTDKEEIYTGVEIEDIRVKMLENPTRYMQVWAKLLSRELIVSNNLLFNTKMRLAEDSDFILRYSRFCKKIVLSPICIYEYSLNLASTMRIFDATKEKDYIYAMSESAKWVDNESTGIQKAFGKYVLMHMNILFVREVFSNLNKKTYKAKFIDMKRVLQCGIFKQAIEKTKIVECTGLRMLPIFFIKMHLMHLASGVYLVRAKQNYLSER